MLAGFEPQRVSPGRGAAPSAFNNGSNAAPSYVTGRVGGRAAAPERSTAERVLTHTIASPFFTGPLRSPSRLQNTFAHESFLDEIAAHVKADPVEFRLRHLRDPRLREVVSRAAQAAGWQTRPSPAPTGCAASRAAAASPACCTKATMATSRWWRKSRGPRVRRDHCHALCRRAGLRTGVESGRYAEPDRRRSAAGSEPGARRGGDVGRPEGHLRRLAQLSQPVARFGDADHRERPHRSPRRRGDWRRRDGNHAGGRGGRQCGVRRDRCYVCAKCRLHPRA